MAPDDAPTLLCVSPGNFWGTGEQALEVVEFLLTAHLYTDDRTLDENDLPPRYRRVFWADAEDDGDEDDSSAAGIERPLVMTESVTRKATGVGHPWDAISDLMLTQREEFSGRLSLTQPEMALERFVKRADYDRLVTNPTVAKSVEDRDDVDVTHADAREQTRPIHADRVWIDSLLDEYFDDEDDAEMFDLVQIRAPEETEMTLDNLILTTDQEGKIHKLMKTIEHREYLADTGPHEIGKILFVGPSETGKTAVSRALAHELGLPFVEVKFSMITSQYLGETAKNVEKTFEVAKRLSPCILFIDEFDSVAKTHRSDEHAALGRAANTLLKSIDDVPLIRDEVILIGTTDHSDQFDPAAWRRFDEIVNFPKPDRGMRADILHVITNRMDIDEFDPSAIVDVTEGLTGSDLRLVLREAVLKALTEERMELTQDDLLGAVADFEECDNPKNLDMMSDLSELVAGAGSGSDDGHDYSHDYDHTDEHEGEMQKDVDAA